MFGSLSMSQLGWRYTSDIVAFTCITFAIIYYSFGGGSQAFSKTINNFREKPSDFKEPLLPVIEEPTKGNKVFNDARSYRSYFTTSQGFRIAMAPSCFVGGYDRSAKGGA